MKPLVTHLQTHDSDVANHPCSALRLFCDLLLGSIGELNAPCRTAGKGRSIVSMVFLW